MGTTQQKLRTDLLQAAVFPAVPAPLSGRRTTLPRHRQIRQGQEMALTHGKGREMALRHGKGREMALRHGKSREMALTHGKGREMALRHGKGRDGP